MKSERLAWAVSFAVALIVHLALFAVFTRTAQPVAGGAGRPDAVSGISEEQFLQLMAESKASEGADEAEAHTNVEVADEPEPHRPDPAAPDDIVEPSEQVEAAPPGEAEAPTEPPPPETPDAIPPDDVAASTPPMNPAVSEEATTLEDARDRRSPRAAPAAEPRLAPPEEPAASDGRSEMPALALAEPLDPEPHESEPVAPDALRPLLRPEATMPTLAPSPPSMEPAQPVEPMAEAIATIEPPEALQPVPEFAEGEFEETRLPRQRPESVPEEILRQYEREQREAEARRIAAEAREEEERRERRRRASAETETGDDTHHSSPHALANPPPSAGAPVGATSGEDEGPSRAAVSSYTGRVYAHLARHKRYPGGTSDRGRATVTFTLSASGGVSGIRLARSSGSAALDQAALSMVQRASPFPPIPSEFGRRSMTFTVPIDFARR